jgi:hypothetical protein
VKFNMNALMKSHPEIDFRAKLEPLSVDMGLEGGLSAVVGALSGAVGEIPIRMRIPFLRRGNLTVASVGGFEAKLNPFGVDIRRAHLNGQVVLGRDGGIKGEGRCAVRCETEMNAKGNFVGKAGNIRLNFEGDEDE